MSQCSAEALAEALASMVSKLREGDTVGARQVGLVALSVYAEKEGLSVDRLLGEGARLEDHPVGAQHRFEMLNTAHCPAGGLVRAAGIVARLT